MWVHLTNAGSADLTKYDGEHFYLNAVGQNYIAVQLGTTDLSTFSNIKIKFKYADNTYSPDVDMVRETLTYPYNDGGSYWVKNNDYQVATFYFNQAGFLGVAGNCVATISFISSGTIAKTGTITFYIEDTVVEEDVPITTDQYAELQLDIADRWKRFLGTTEERLAAEKDQYTIYADTTTGLDYIWNGSSFIALGEHSDLALDADEDDHIKSIYYNGTTYYPTKFIKFEYNDTDDTEFIEGDIPSLTDYNENYLYYNFANNSYYRYDKGNESLMLTGNANCNFRLIYDDINDRYNLADGNIVRLRKIAQSRSAAMFVMFQFVGGDYDGRRYLMNYNYNSTAHKYDFVCVDFDIDEEGEPPAFASAEKFKLSLFDTATTGVYGVWYKVNFVN